MAILKFVASLAVTVVATTLFGCSCNKSPAPTVAQPDAPVAVAADIFEDVTSQTGIDFTYRNGEEARHLSILESLGGGVGVLDFDGDGQYDLFLVGGGEYSGPEKKDIVGRPCKLFRNMGKLQFKDVTTDMGLDKLAGGKPWFYTHGAAVGDFDRDGRSDLLVLGWGRVALFRNVDGKRFEDVTAKAGLDKGITWATSAAWADFDGDGWPDLYVCQYVDWSFANHPPCTYDGKTPDVCPPKNFSGLMHKVYRNNTDGTFTDVSDTCGLLKGGAKSSKGLGVLVVDVDGDCKPDVYVCNDTVNNFLYLNKSTKGQIRFEECGNISGCAADNRGNPNGSMGADAGDYDGSGRPAIWVTNYENELHALYRNRCQPGEAAFNFQTAETGIAVIGQKFVGWGTAFMDFDLDGWEDLFVSNGHAIHYPTDAGVTRKQKPVLLLNQGDGTFVPASRRIGPYGQVDHLGRGVGFVDLNNDGKVDMVLNHLNEPTAVLRNIAADKNHWLGVQLIGAKNADVVGARVVLEAGGRKQTRFAKGGGSYLSSSDRRLVFGLGAADRIDKLTVHWPDGTQTPYAGLDIDRYHVLKQPQEKAGRDDAKK